MATTFGILDYCIFIGLLAASALIGVYYVIKEKWQTKMATADDILMGGREMGIFPVAMSLIASYMSAITVLGIPTEIYLFGTGYWMVALAGILTYPVTCHIFLPFFHDMGLSSAYQYLELRFCRTARYIASVIFTIEMLLYMAVVLYAPSLALNQVTGLPLWVSIVTVGGVVTFYTSMGGLRAVLWTDTFQTFIVIGGLIALIVIGCQRLGGLAHVWSVAELGERINFLNFDPSPFTRLTVWGAVFGSFIGQLTIYGANQTMLQRYMAIKNVKNSQIALYISLPATFLLISLVCLTGLVIYATYRSCDPLLNGQIISNDQLLPFLAMDTLGQMKGVPGLFVACIFAAALSSISSCLNATSITLLEDIIKPCLEGCKKSLSPHTEAWLAKLLGVFGGGIVIGLAFLSSILGNTVLQIMITALGMAGGPLLGLFLLGMFCPGCNSKGAISATIISTAVTFWIAIGSFVTHTPQPELPLSTSGCVVHNETLTYSHLNSSMAISHTQAHGVEENWTGIKLIYRLSFLWYPTVSVGVSIVTGVIVSWFTCWNGHHVDARYIYPVCGTLCCCLPKCLLNRCYGSYQRVLPFSLGDNDIGPFDEEEEVTSNRNITTSRETARLIPSDIRSMGNTESGEESPF
ncbi:sodium-coupled monocarboxylate transporter 1-like [Haliotis cracherodii]|uniref:sodium-coupled monocarboxylate transporter 1-like n=1 Tax=Haliotis cracherodii TaxID=6455 RepID=UPI0039E99874